MEKFTHQCGLFRGNGIDCSANVDVEARYATVLDVQFGPAHDRTPVPLPIKVEGLRSLTLLATLDPDQKDVQADTPIELELDNGQKLTLRPSIPTEWYQGSANVRTIAEDCDQLVVRCRGNGLLRIRVLQDPVKAEAPGRGRRAQPGSTPSNESKS